MATAPSFRQSSTIDAAGVAGFAAIADEWWDERGKFAPLHRLNPTRISYLRAQLTRHFARDDQSATPLANLSLLDVGAGGGLTCEPMARLGAAVTGIDAAAESVAVAKAHADAQKLAVTYRTMAAEDLVKEGAQYDVVLALEIVEHVADTALFYDALAALVKPGGMLIMSTLNRTAKSFALGIVGAEYILRWVPRGTHRWQQFVKPSEMAGALIKRGFSITDTTGLVLDPIQWSFALNPRDLDVNYLLSAEKTS